MIKAKDVSSAVNAEKQIPNVKENIGEEKSLPDVEMNKENCIEIEGKFLEIKPTLLKYFRNNAISAYELIDKYPLPTIFRSTLENNGLDGDAAILTFVSAVLDDVKLAQRIYKTMDAGQLLKMVEIFKRVNGIDVREDRQKNVVATKVNR